METRVKEIPRVVLVTFSLLCPLLCLFTYFHVHGIVYSCHVSVYEFVLMKEAGLGRSLTSKQTQTHGTLVNEIPRVVLVKFSLLCPLLCPLFPYFHVHGIVYPCHVSVYEFVVM